MTRAKILVFVWLAFSHVIRLAFGGQLQMEIQSLDRVLFIISIDLVFGSTYTI